MAELLFVSVIALASLTAIVWLLEDYKKLREQRIKNKKVQPLLGVALPKKKDKTDE